MKRVGILNTAVIFNTCIFSDENNPAKKRNLHKENQPNTMTSFFSLKHISTINHMAYQGRAMKF